MKKENIFIRFLYNSCFGRFILRFLTSPWISSVARVFLISPLSKPMIKGFVKKNGIDMNEYETIKYNSFNSFFIRKRKAIEYDENSIAVISPCDGYLSIYEINDDSVFDIKNSSYNVKDLLKNDNLAESFKGGYCFIYRLTPRHFHRYSYVDNGEIISSAKIPGKLHCVRPVALNRYPVYIQNQREYQIIETENFGKIVQMEIGAIIVGRIKNHKESGRIFRGQEKGYFEFGGSTIIVLFKKDMISPDKIILANTKKDIETEIKIGNKTAEKNQV